ncbi:hypothetical protein [Actinophytocola algeriensis]|uniref:Uncharacterized protein n=1 Tax=Actinophytocola algeriensis TaxID=1768010 RepID=A0A7W7VH20_9PSEU|nr:hypothetical protein [Actinophytocola algeriensis]MBB4909734.1 hypothetical protein [Actinophytocola algeriensis]MBE1475724.1 hypothetical protein [Actinophytocola algeriensis]
MICPHCSKNLLRRHRTGSKCTYCDRTFAFDPKTNGLQLHDLKVRRQAARLAEGGLSYTSRQLWYAVSRKKVTEPVQPLNGCGCGTFVLLTVAVVFVAAAIQPPKEVFAGVVIGAVALLVVANIVFAVLRPILAARAEIHPPVLEIRFRTMLSDWRRVYGASPPGMIDTVPRAMVQAPEAALVCQDGSVLDCLNANGVPHRNKLALATNAAGVPPEVPVVLLHDASVAGLRFAAATRAALPGRVVVDAGLRPSTVLHNRGLLRLRGPRGAGAELRRHGLSREEVEWLAAGWWSPIGAVPPAKLLSAVDRALTRTDRARAAEVGFMTWPE